MKDLSVDQIRDRLHSLSLDELKELTRGDHHMLVAFFLYEMGCRDDAVESGQVWENVFEVTKVWKRWLPLVREKTFLQTLEEVASEMEENASSGRSRRVIQEIRETAGRLNRMSDTEVRQYFESRSSPEDLESSVVEEQARAVYQTGNEAADRGDLNGARVYYGRAIDMFLGLGNDQMLAQVALSSANLLARNDERAEAEKLYETAATAFERLEDTTNRGLTLYNAGHSMFEGGEPDRARELTERAVRALSTGKDGADQVAELCATLMFRITSSVPLTDRVERYQQIVHLLEELALQKELGGAYVKLGSALAEMKRLHEGYEAAVKGVRLIVASGAPAHRVRWALGVCGLTWKAIGRPLGEWVAVAKELTATSGPVAKLGDICLALTEDVHSGKLAIEEAQRRLSEEHDREPFDANAVATLEGEMRGALRQVDTVPAELLRIFVTNLRLLVLAAELTGSHETGAAAHLSLGRVYDQQGRVQEAAQAFERGAELARHSGNTEFQITMRLNNATAVRRAGDWRTATSRLEAILTDLQVADADTRQPDVYLELASLYQEQGNLREAEGAASRGLQVLEGLQAQPPGPIISHLEASEAGLCAVLGLVHKYTDRYVMAETYLERSRHLYHSLENREGEARTLGNLAGVRLDLHDVGGALILYNRAFHMIENLPNSRLEGFVCTGRAIALSLKDQNAEARRMAARALDMDSPVEQTAQCLAVLVATATTEAERVDALDRAERLLTSSEDPMAQLPILSSLLELAEASPHQKQEWQDRLRNVGESLGGLQGAYVYLKMADLHDQTGEGRSAAIHDLERCMSMIDEVAADNREPAVQQEMFSTASIAARRVLQLKSEDHRACLETVLRAKARATLNERFVAARTLDELQVQLAQQAEPVLLVEMYVLPTETHLYFVTARGLQGFKRIPVTAEVLMAENNVISRLGHERHYETAWQSKTWADISAQFAGALETYLRPGQLVCLIPAGFWHFLPLHACAVGGRPLVERNPVYYGPSSSILSRPGDERRPLRRCLAVGVVFEDEAAWVASQLGGNAVLAASADPTMIAMAMHDKDVVHFSCHGAYNPLRATESGLKLAHGAWLTPTVIGQWTTSADLVFLAACETALNFVTAGNDAVGLEQAFLNMGAASVVGTLWPVKSSPTRRFVEALYTNLLGGADTKQMSKAHALQAAVSDLREHFGHPYFWAPFKLTGAWR